MFDYINIKSIYGELYFKFPKALIYSDTYKSLTSDAKLAYMLLRDRLEYSVKNNWYDTNGNIYFIFTNDELMTILNCSKPKVIKIKKELQAIQLLHQVQQGLNKPNRLYLANLKVNADDVYIKNNLTFDSKGSKNSLLPENHTETLDTKGSKNSLLPENHTETLDTKGSKNSLPNQYITKDLDTNRHLIDTDKDELQNQILLDNFVESCHNSQVPTFIPDRVLQLIATFSPNYECARQTVKTIHNAKYKAQEQTGITIVFEELEQQGIPAEAELYQTLLKAYQKNKTEKVKDIQSLIFVYVRNWFVEKPIALIQQAQSGETLPEVTMDSWL
ncbi:replication initiator protein A [Enterococcus sp. AZ103]|uniref:replication initiator protein A n=1 Tax=Enterococcus sp. AZ103 TaxID=2774628 RepID=UPI003F219AC3